MSLGRKPVPGGELYVWRMLERTRALSCWGLSLGAVRVAVAEGKGKEASGMGCEMMPMPSLLAEPSQPRARRRRFLEGLSGEGDILAGLYGLMGGFDVLRRKGESG